MTELTQEQQALIPSYREKWLAIGRSIGGTDFDKAKQHIIDAYAVAGLTIPNKWYTAESPIHGLKQAQKISKMNRDELLSFVCYGSGDARWLGFYDFFLNVVGVESCNRLLPLMQLANVCGWWWPFDEAVVMTPKPTIFQYDDRGRIHAEDGPAIDYDGAWSIWAWHGVRVPQQVIETPSTLTIKQITSYQNTEIRRVAMERYGWDRYIQDAKATKIHADDWGILWEIPNGNERIRLVQVVNATMEPDGTFKRYFLQVNPAVTTALDAVASTFRRYDGTRMTGAQYAKMLVAQS